MQYAACMVHSSLVDSCQQAELAEVAASFKIKFSKPHWQSCGVISNCFVFAFFKTHILEATHLNSNPCYINHI